MKKTLFVSAAIITLAIGSSYSAVAADQPLGLAPLQGEEGTSLSMPQLPMDGVMAETSTSRGVAGGSFGSTIPALRSDPTPARPLGMDTNTPTTGTIAAPAPVAAPATTPAEIPAQTLAPSDMVNAPAAAKDGEAVPFAPVAPDTAANEPVPVPLLNSQQAISQQGVRTADDGQLLAPLPTLPQAPSVKPAVPSGFAATTTQTSTRGVAERMTVTPDARTTVSQRGVPYPQVVPQPGLIYEVEKIDNIGSETLITRKITDMTDDLGSLQNAVALAKDQLENIRYNSEIQTADYYGLVAAINARLQAGSTSGNPRLVNSWNIAQERLDRLATDVADLNKLAGQVAAQANMANFLLEAVRATYGLSGALESDHADLTILEDDTTTTVVQINRLLNEITDDINRRTAYLSSERKNLQALALGITNGELYGRSISNAYFRPVSDPMSAQGRARIEGEGQKPLAVIRFNRENVEYQQPVYAVMNKVLEREPGANFEIIAVSPDKGNPAQRAVATTSARQKAEDVLRSLSNMGLPMDKVKVSSASSDEVDTSEVHIFTR